MPTVLSEKGFRFFFYSYDCREPRHVHVDKERKEAKYWLDPLRLARNTRFTNHELREIEAIITAHIEEVRREWDDHCNN